MKTRTPCLFVLLVAALGTGIAHADIIDFETGFERLAPVTVVTTSSNTTTFSTSTGTAPFVANVDIPKDAFEVVVTPGNWNYDEPTGGTPGRFFATHGPENPGDYLFDMQFPITSFGIDLYDYVGDGGAKPTDFVTLSAFSDKARTDLVDSAMFVVPIPRPADGLAVRMSVAAPSIAAVTLSFSTPDRGTGIDNIEFVTIPEGSTLVLLCLGTLGLLSSLRTRRFRAR